MSQAFDAVKHDEEELLLKTYGRYPVAVDHGKGSRLWDVDGKEYIDLLAGIAVTAVGHCNDEVNEALMQQANTLWHVSNLFYQKPQLELARLLLSTAHFGKAFFCNSGAEANEAAIKLARRYQAKVKGRDAVDIITLTSCFHGRTLATLAATGREDLMDGFKPVPEGFKQVPAGDLDALAKAMDEHTAAVLIECIQGEGGVLPLGQSYIQGVERLCRKHGALFMCDEVQAGMGRSGKFWSFQNYDVKPDVISMAKALANGLAMGGILATDEVAKGFTYGSHASTFGGGCLASAVGAKVVEIMLRDHLPERAAKLGQDLREKARDLQIKIPGKIKQVRGLGLFIGIELEGSARPAWEELIKRGFICSLCHETTLRLVPALTIDEADLDAFINTLANILGQ